MSLSSSAKRKATAPGTVLLRAKRTNLRLRALIDDLQNQIVQHRRDLDVQFQRIAALQAQVDHLLAKRRQQS